MRKLFLLLMVAFAAIACSAEVSDLGETEEQVDFVEDELSTCRYVDINGDGVVERPLEKNICVFDRNNTNPNDDLRAFDVSWWNFGKHTGCWRYEILGGFGPDCFLTKGYHPDTNNRSYKLLIRGNEPPGEARVWRYYTKAKLDAGQCEAVWFNTCQL